MEEKRLGKEGFGREEMSWGGGRMNKRGREGREIINLQIIAKDQR